MPFGHWAGGERLPDGSIQMPWYEFSAEAERFLDDVRGAGWVTPFDLPRGTTDLVEGEGSSPGRRPRFLPSVLVRR